MHYKRRPRRGFVIESLGKRVVVTAAHCLPEFPPASLAYGFKVQTYAELLGPLEGKPSVCVDCLFADPIADIAVLGSPDGQELWDQARGYDAIVDPLKPFRIAEAPEKGTGWLLSLEGKWFQCTVSYVKPFETSLWVSQLDQPIAGGVSGSPILSDNGKAIGVVALAGSRYGEPNPRLTRDLPARFLRTRRIPFKLTPEQKAQIANLPSFEPPHISSID